MPRKKVIETGATEQAGEAVVKTAAKRTSTKKVEEIYLQLDGKEWNLSECKDRAAAAYVAGGHKASSIKKLVVYLKPEEGKAYYVVNDEDNGSIDI